MWLLRVRLLSGTRGRTAVPWSLIGPALLSMSECSHLQGMVLCGILGRAFFPAHMTAGQHSSVTVFDWTQCSQMIHILMSGNAVPAQPSWAHTVGHCFTAEQRLMSQVGSSEGGVYGPFSLFVVASAWNWALLNTSVCPSCSRTF